LCPADGTVAVPDGVGIDLGGIGKGLAGDIVVAELLDAGADGACVNLGGDLRAAGRPPAGDDWVISVEHPRDHSIEVARVAIVEGAVATSYADGRRWHRGGEVLRHIVDPATGTSVEPRCAVTVIAGEGWWAEVLATSATVEGGTNMTSLVTGLGGEAMSVRADGTIEYSAGFAAFSV
jgi:thiamine biosynthesis lipoprotein